MLLLFDTNKAKKPSFSSGMGLIGRDKRTNVKVAVKMLISGSKAQSLQVQICEHC